MALKAIIATGFGKLHFHETARALAAAGVEINFLTGWLPKPKHAAIADFLGNVLGEKNLAKRLNPRRIEIPGATVTPIAWAEFAGTLFSRLQRARLLPESRVGGMPFRLAARGSRKYLKDADVLLLRSGAGQCGAIKTARANGLAIVTDQSIAHPAFLEEVLREEFERAGLRFGYDANWDLWKLVLRDCEQADLLMVNSDFVKETFVERGFPADKIRVVYLGVRESFFDLKRDYRIQGRVNVLFTGNFDPRKGPRFLLEAVRRCRRGGLDVHLQLIGNLADGASLLRDSDADFFTHTPFMPPEELPAAFSEADLFVLPTLAEGSSRSAMEAAAAGMPIITTRNCGLPLEHEKSVLYTPIKDSGAVADAIARLAADSELRERLGRSAMGLVTGNYTWADYGRRAREVFREAIGMREGSPISADASSPV